MSLIARLMVTPGQRRFLSAELARSLELLGPEPARALSDLEADERPVCAEFKTEALFVLDQPLGEMAVGSGLAQHLRALGRLREDPLKVMHPYRALGRLREDPLKVMHPYHPYAPWHEPPHLDGVIAGTVWWPGLRYRGAPR